MHRTLLVKPPRYELSFLNAPDFTRQHNATCTQATWTRALRKEPYTSNLDQGPTQGTLHKQPGPELYLLMHILLTHPVTSCHFLMHRILFVNPPRYELSFLNAPDFTRQPTPLRVVIS